MLHRLAYCRHKTSQLDLGGNIRTAVGAFDVAQSYNRTHLSFILLLRSNSG